MHHLLNFKSKSPKFDDQMINQLCPIFDTSTESGRAAGRLEKFSHYVARQLGFKDESECVGLCELVQEYLKRSKGCDNSIFEYFANEQDAESLYVKLENELERCILAYFAFHWSKASMLITQVLSVDSEQKRLKDLVMAATRKQRFEKITKELNVTRVFSTLVEEMKAIGTVSSNDGNGESRCTDVMVPVAHSQRSPVLLLMGGGMGAGKSTVLKDILKQSFWLEAAANAVVVEADAFKETDVIYRALSSRGHHNDMLQTAELVHQNSTDAASSLLVTALNEGRDVIMDGTLSWEPFVEQTIVMARNVHKHRYRMGEGYKVAEDGTVTENYWEQIEQEKGEETANKIIKPYRIELVGVVCDPYLAVVRGIRRAIATGRAVRVKPQLNSHKRFANAFPKYCELVDNARLYCTNALGSKPPLIAWKDGENKMLVEPEDIKCLEMVKKLKEEAESIYELYEGDDVLSLQTPGSVWKDIVLIPTRSTLQQELKTAILKIENRGK
ncbi:calmodulin calcium-dependent NAD kinase isoform X2 [Solanum stenotomum]|uniref:calmodulin calcium-dependent NAD kinase isoform X2 n=1 Tax=Solanum stenotomum TaxID=172797 RepID=UPI0020D18404|nr:calmodulin calcium-dependent NAD kinase isoform X2 [Solanum stenotomum]